MTTIGTQNITDFGLDMDDFQGLYEYPELHLHITG